jgi:UDP-glucose 4-epimerase
MNTKPTALVTGVAGFIGSHVADHLLAQGYTVIGVDDLSGGFLEIVPDGVDFHQGSITDVAFIADLFAKHRFDYVYHIAAYAAEGLSHFIRRFNYTNNLIGSVNLINESVKQEVKCFVFTSSIAVYGPGQTPMTEDTTPLPEDPYGVSKYAVELDLEAAKRMFDLDYIIFRPHNVYGSRQNIADRYRNVIGIFMNQVMQDQPMSVFGDGLQTRAFSHIDDVAPVIARSVEVPEAYNEVFNVGADTPYTVLQLAEEVANAFGVEPTVKHLEARKEVVHAYSAHDKVRSVFNPPEAVTLHDGIVRMAEWVKARGPMAPVTFDYIEVEKNLPPSWKV